MHAEAFAFLTTALSAERATGAHLLEIGAYNVNGSARELCGTAATYVGVDRRPGPGVDVIDPDDSFDGAGTFDLVISSETLEHADNPAGLIASAWRALHPGGQLILTAAGPGRAPHTCNGEPNPARHGEHYANISVEQLTALLADWTDVEVRYGRSHGHPHGDVYATAHKPRVIPTDGPTNPILGDDGAEVVTDMIPTEPAAAAEKKTRRRRKAA